MKKDKNSYRDSKWFIQSGFTKIISKLSNEPSPLFPEKFDEFKKSKYGSGPAKIKTTTSKGHFEFISENGQYYQVSDNYRYNYYGRDRRCSNKSIDPVKITPGKSVIVPLETAEFSKDRLSSDRKFLCVVNEAGKKIEMGEYYYG